MQHLFKLIIFIFLCIYMSFPHAFATEKNKEFYPGCTSKNQGDFCEEKYNEYEWGDKWPTLNIQINKLSELIRQAILANDYSKLEQHINLPMSFVIDRGTERTEDNSQSLIVAHTFKEFEDYFRFSIHLDLNRKLDLEKDGYERISYYRLYGYIHEIMLNIICIDPKSSKVTERVSSIDRNYCDLLAIKIGMIIINNY